jgi:hypothetical protein
VLYADALHITHTFSTVSVGTITRECVRGAKDEGCLYGDESFVELYHYYLHTDLEEDGCVVGSAFVPAESGWPDKYKFLFIDPSPFSSDAPIQSPIKDTSLHFFVSICIGIQFVTFLDKKLLPNVSAYARLLK